ncbi:Glycogenin-1 [Araneus ventricosus]|uniref:glycogenin glucosyltransferase n=1 Tax=Araneus ventricosus TaxID=182803 RepID=A0A4Y2PE52_ARAVE|nr:Glycogenin-1 [Araneus ventricosus]
MADSLKNNISNGIHCKESSEAYKPCLKHAAENLSQKSKPDVSSEAELCNGCSKTMLSYIFLIQDMLDGLARKLSKDEDPSCCVQCLRQESRGIEDLPRVDSFNNSNLKSKNLVISNGIANGECEALSSKPTVSERKNEVKADQKLDQDVSPMVTHAAEVTSEPKRPRKVSSRRNSRRISREVKENVNDVFPESCASRNGWQTDFLYNVSSSIEPKYIPYNQQQENENIPAASVNKKSSSQKDILVNHKENELLINHRSRSNSSDSSPLTPCSPSSFFGNLGPPSKAYSERSLENSNFNKSKVDDYAKFDYSVTECSSNYHKYGADDFAKPDYSIIENALNHSGEEGDDSAKSDYSGIESNSSHCEADTDDYLKSDYSGTESLDKKVYGMGMEPAKNRKTFDENAEKWRTLHDSFSDRVAAKDLESSEAFVTICRNNAEALGCLVLGSSLLLSRTSRKLCVLVFDEVDPVFKEPLSSIFHVVQHVRHLKSIDETRLEYLEQMNLEKLNIWCLVEFSKCVFLNPDCLILCNCDELFQHEELSAVPDIGWPDCFNSGVFVFAPSVDTLSKLVELSQKQGQNNEGDQMLLNAYFNSWSSDIGKKLSFIYNLTRSASYTYGAAFQRFGHNVKIVQFLGGSKPWEVKFFTQTGQLESDVDVHPKHVRFFSEWINTFKLAVLKLFPQDVYTYAFNQRSVSAEDIGLALCFPALYKDSDQKSFKPVHILPKRRSVSPFYLASPPRKTAECNASLLTPVYCQLSDIPSVEEVAQKLITSGCIEQNGKVEDEAQNGKIEDETVLKDSPFDRCLPGAIIGDYQGMKAWEQGHIDYEGCDSSENIMNRLSFLIRGSVYPNL